MKVKLEDLVTSEESLRALMKSNLNALISFRVSNIISEARSHIMNFYEVRNEKVRHYGEKRSDSEWEVKEENMDVFTNEIKELLNVEVEIRGDKISIKELVKSNGEYIDISPMTLMTLKWMIKE